uniref:SGNH hydrolase-type esterase domain-containing protein n=1 Tax=Leersia perrieri TaxID=77586 RepID=A0A0D9WAD7_9ORYZ
MTNLSLLIACFLLIFVLNVADHVEARPAPVDFGDSDNGFYSLFVFGDSFADTGNLPKSHLSESSREWYYPYGSNWGSQPTGRFSNAMVDRFRDLVQDGTVTRHNLHNSVALVAISGNDYDRLSNVSSTDKMVEFIEKVTSEIAKQVHRLKNNGVSKVLVNNLHPVGCTPWLTRPSNYSGCSLRGNMGSYIHGGNLQKKLNATDLPFVFHVDLNTAFSNIVNPDPKSKHDFSKQFKQRLSPCCESTDPNGFCGQKGEDGKDLFTLCKNPDEFFYWDDVHPTEAGWKAVMQQLKGPIKNFLGVN